MKSAILIFEVLTFLYIGLIIVTQIIRPLYNGTKLFPFIRDSVTDREVELRTAMMEAEDELYLQQLEEDLEELRNEGRKPSVAEIIEEAEQLRKKKENNNDADDDGA